jgi:RNA polymerase primary sigma factor
VTGGSVEFDDPSERLKQLVHIAKTRGYILYDEIDAFLLPTLEGDAHLDIVLTELAKNGIEIFEEPGARYDIVLTEDGKVSAEKGLQKLIERLDNSSPIRMYLLQVMTVPRLTREDEIELAKRISHGGKDAENAMRKLIEANLYLVVAVARRRSGLGCDLLELLQEGNIGLMQATEKYKHTREYRFSTYAIWWIRRSIERSKLEN